MKFAFVTCVRLGKSCIERIYKIGGKLDLIITLHDGRAVKKSGRVYLDDFCTANKIPLFKINHINDEESIEILKTHKIDWLFIIGWSQIANKNILETVSKGVLGMHPTLLPVGRGRAAIPWAILKELKETGVTLFKLDEGVDTGKIALQKKIPMETKETATTLYHKVNRAHEDLIEDVWFKLLHDKIELKTQDESKATYWPGRKPEDGEITAKMTVAEADKLVRAATKPYPGAYMMEGTRKIIIWEGSMQPEDETTLKLYLRDGIYYAKTYEITNIL